MDPKLEARGASCAAEHFSSSDVMPPPDNVFTSAAGSAAGVSTSRASSSSNSRLVSLPAGVHAHVLHLLGCSWSRRQLRLSCQGMRGAADAQVHCGDALHGGLETGVCVLFMAVWCAVAAESQFSSATTAYFRERLSAYIHVFGKSS